MSEKIRDRIVLGHNQFFGTNHLSATRGAETERMFSDIDKVKELIDFSYSQGVTGMMLSTHPRTKEILQAVKEDPNLKNNLGLYPLLPYIAKYVRLANERGLVNLVFDTLKGTDISNKFHVMFTGGLGVLRKDMTALLKSLISVEMIPFEGTQIRAVFLHDALTDLALGLDMAEIFHFYTRYMREQFGAEGAFATKNLPFFLSRMESYGITNPLVMTHFNKTGFSMNPSREACEKILDRHPVRILAMGTLASGKLKPDEAYNYLSAFPQIESVVVGYSSKAHGSQTIDSIKRQFKLQSDA